MVIEPRLRRFPERRARRLRRRRAGGDSRGFRCGDPAEAARRDRTAPHARAQRRPWLVELRDGDTLLAAARAGDLSLDAPLPVTRVEAEEAAKRHPGLRGHLFPRCFGCGPRRHRGRRAADLPRSRRRTKAGRSSVDSAGRRRRRVGAGSRRAGLGGARLPTAVVADRPCAGRFAGPCGDRSARGEGRAPRVGREPHVVMAWPLGREGRRWFAAAAVVGPGGELCALGRQTATTVSWGVPLGGSHWCSDGTDEITHRHEEE